MPSEEAVAGQVDVDVQVDGVVDRGADPRLAVPAVADRELVDVDGALGSDAAVERLADAGADRKDRRGEDDLALGVDADAFADIGGIDQRHDRRSEGERAGQRVAAERHDVRRAGSASRRAGVCSVRAS